MTDPVLKVSPPTGGQWELLTTTNATTGGTHDKRTTTNFEHHATSAQARTGCGSGCTSRANSGLSNHACSGVRKPLAGSVGSTNAWGFSRGLGHAGFRISPEAVGKGASTQSWRAGVHNISSPLLCDVFSSYLRRINKGFWALFLQYQQCSTKAVSGLGIATGGQIADGHLPASDQRGDTRLAQTVPGLNVRNDGLPVHAPHLKRKYDICASAKAISLQPRVML